MCDQNEDQALLVKNLDVFYGPLEVLFNVSLNVKNGEIVSLIGPNGHGKSTLLKTICGLIKPSKGEIFFNSFKISNLPAYRITELGLVYVPEAGNLFPNLTVKENLLLGAYTKKAWNERRKSLDVIFELFPQLKRRENQRVSTLSGGERKMVTLGRALMGKPKMLLIDEPSLGLAPNLVEKVYEKVYTIKDMGLTILLVDQNINYLRKINRAYLIENGRIVGEGSVDDVLIKGRYVFLGDESK
jgi:branched-chain amino acid transport system ATP-binding protein